MYIDFIQYCGELLYADFKDTDSNAIDDLSLALQQQSATVPSSSLPLNNSESAAVPITEQTRPGAQSEDIASVLFPSFASNREDSTWPRAQHNSLASYQVRNTPYKRYFAMCLPIRGIYKTLLELDVSNIKSDGNFFYYVRTMYASRGMEWWSSPWMRWIKWKPTSVEFVQV